MQILTLSTPPFPSTEDLENHTPCYMSVLRIKLEAI